MKIVVNVLFNPDVSPWAFVSVSYKDGQAGRVVREHTRCRADSSHEELHEVVCGMLEKGLTTGDSGSWEQLELV